MDKNNVLNSVQNLIEEDDPNNPFDSPKEQLERRKMHLEEEYHKIRTINRKLWFGLWLYRFMNTKQTTSSTSSPHLRSSTRKQFCYYLTAFLILILSLSIFPVISFISQNQIS